MVNSRLTFRELADRLDLSVNAVHKRIQRLMKSGIIRTFTAKISLVALKAIPILVFGRSEAHTIEQTIRKLGDNESTFWVSVAGGNYLYIGAYLRDIFKLEPYVEYVKKEGAIQDPTVGIIHGDLVYEEQINAVYKKIIPAYGDAQLKSLDYQIIYSLHKNSRKPVLEIAEELGISVKTVRRRLSNLIQKGLIELSLEWYPDASNDIITIFHLYLKTHVDKDHVKSVLKKYLSPAFFFFSFSNLPNLIVGAIWTSTMKNLKEIYNSLRSENIFESVVPNILYSGHIFDTWRDDLVIEKGKPNL